MRSSSTALREQRAARRAALAGGRPIQYRLPKPGAEPSLIAPAVAPKAEEPEELFEDYTPMVRGVLRAATTLFLSQALSAILIANYLGGQLQIRFYFKLFPYVAILSSRDLFVSILTWSTTIAVSFTCIAILTGLARHRHEQKLLDGWATGLFMSGLLLVMQYVRHVLDPPAIDGWVLAQTAAGVVAATVIFLGFRPEVDRPTQSRHSAGPKTVQAGESKRTQPRNKIERVTR